MMPNFHVVLIEPDIAANTGTIARSCLATGSALHLVGRLGFHLSDRMIRRAGLDYWQHVEVHRHTSWEECRSWLFGRQPGAPIHYFSARARRIYTQAEFARGCALVFGSETRGLPASLLAGSANCLTIPMLDARVRSLNVATAAGIVLYEAVRQNGLGAPRNGE